MKLSKSNYYAGKYTHVGSCRKFCVRLLGSSRPPLSQLQLLSLTHTEQPISQPHHVAATAIIFGMRMYKRSISRAYEPRQW
jgi:transposase-like protein